MSTMTCADVERDELVPRYVAGRLPAPERDAFEEHLVGCARCQEDVRLGAALREALAESAVVAPVARGASRFPPGARWAAVPLAAAAVAALLLLPRLDGESDAQRLGEVAQAPIWLGVAVRAELPASGEEQFEAAMATYEAQRWDDAAEELAAALEAGADPVPTGFFLGAARLMANRPRGAVESFDAVIARGDTPYLPEARYYRAKALLRMDRADEALAELEAAAAGGGTIGEMARGLADSVRALPTR